MVSLAIINSYFSALILKEHWDALIIQASGLAMVVQHDGGEEYAEELKNLVDQGYAQLLAAAQGKTDDGGECLAHLVRILKVKKHNSQSIADARACRLSWRVRSPP